MTPYTQAMTTPALPRLKLPLGIQNLRQIREGGYYYVDKSGMAVDLIEAGKYYFLSRPRRFGKSLLVDTLKELFEGNRAL
ncbi:Predicted AAA-ATPase, partial [Sphaerotilus natans]